MVNTQPSLEELGRLWARVCEFVEAGGAYGTGVEGLLAFNDDLFEIVGYTEPDDLDELPDVQKDAEAPATPTAQSTSPLAAEPDRAREP